MNKLNDIDTLTPENDTILRALGPAFDALQEIREEPCAFCGEYGDTLPCLVCDVLVCGECGIGVRWCRGCGEGME